MTSADSDKEARLKSLEGELAMTKEALKSKDALLAMAQDSMKSQDALVAMAQEAIKSKDTHLDMAKLALQAKDDKLTAVLQAKGAMISAKEEQLAAAIKDKEEAQESERMLRQQNQSLLAAQTTQMNVLAEIYTPTPPKPPVNSLELKLVKDSDGNWFSGLFVIEDDNHKKSNWLLGLGLGLRVMDELPPILVLFSDNLQKIVAYANFEVLDEKMKMSKTVFDGVFSYKNVPMQMSLAKFNQLTQGLDSIKVKVEIIVCSMK